MKAYTNITLINEEKKPDVVLGAQAVDCDRCAGMYLCKKLGEVLGRFSLIFGSYTKRVVSSTRQLTLKL